MFSSTHRTRNSCPRLLMSVPRHVIQDDEQWSNIGQEADFITRKNGVFGWLNDCECGFSLLPLGFAAAGVPSPRDSCYSVVQVNPKRQFVPRALRHVQAWAAYFLRRCTTPRGRVVRGACGNQSRSHTWGNEGNDPPRFRSASLRYMDKGGSCIPALWNAPLAVPGDNEIAFGLLLCTHEVLFFPRMSGFFPGVASRRSSASSRSKSCAARF
jgi:hypothetical protein